MESEGLKSAKDLAFWLDLALAFNPTAKKSAKKEADSQSIFDEGHGDR